MTIDAMGRKKTLAGAPLGDLRTTANRFRWSRENYGEKGISRERLAERINASMSNEEEFELVNGKLIESIERNLASTKLLEKLAPKIANALNFRNTVDGDWFFNLRDFRNPYYESNISAYDDPVPFVDVPFYEVTLEGVVSTGTVESKKIPVAAGIAAKECVAFRIPNDHNAPRLTSGQILFVQKMPQYFDGNILAADHPTERTRNELGKWVPVVIFGQKQNVDGQAYLVPINTQYPKLPLKDLTIHGRGVVLRTVYAEGWWSDEVAPEGLPVKIP